MSPEINAQRHAGMKMVERIPQRRVVFMLTQVQQHAQLLKYLGQQQRDPPEGIKLRVDLQHAKVFIGLWLAAEYNCCT
jgi:hypothetical protein